MKRAGAVLTLLLCLVAGTAAHAVSPHLRWHTIETEHFRVHFHEGPNMEALAQRTAAASEAAHALLSPSLRWQPKRKTDVILTDDVDSANGSAFTLYRPWMRLYAEAPEAQSVLNDYEDHLWILVVHEYAHVLHLDKVHGLPTLVNAVFGKLLIPNAYVPRWMTEGFATWQESKHSNAGRLRSSLFDMWLRASVLEAPFRLDEVTHVPHDWPRGSLAYLYGGHFLSFIGERVGDEKVPDFFELYGRRLIPGTLNDASHSVWGEDFVALYDAWLTETRTRYEAQLQPVREAGVTRATRLTRSANGTDSPHFTPDGARIVYLNGGTDRRPQLRSMKPDGTDDRLVKALWSGGPLHVSPDGAHVVISQPEVFEEYQVFDDLYEVEVATGKMERLTEGLRATDPSYSPDGKLIAFVGRSGGGRSYLGLFDRQTREVRRVLDATERERLYGPVFTLDGSALVFSQKRGVGHRLARVPLNEESAEPETLLESEALILQPRLAPDGTILFSSDRTGIYNLWSLDPDTRALRQLTNVETGAFHPSPAPDGRIAFLSYTHEGYDVSLLDASDRHDAKTPAAETALRERPPRPPAVWNEAEVPQPLPVRRYNPLPSLRPLYWLPTLGADPIGTTLGISTGGADILDRHLWSLDASIGLASREPAFSASYTSRAFHPGFDAWAGTTVSQAAGFRAGLYDRQWVLGARTRLPATRLDRTSAVTLSYELRTFDPQFSPTLRPDDVVPTLPREGRTGVAGLSFAFTNARSYTHSVSNEEGFSLSAGIRHSSPLTLGTFTFSSADVRAQRYLKMPWRSHHVLALQALGGVAVGDLGGRPVYALGGIGVADPLQQLVFGGRVGGGLLRGYAPRSLAGNTFAFGSAEYRLPLTWLDRGVDTIPLFLRRIHAAAFVDVGATGREAFTLDAPRVGVGAELRTDFVVAYALSAQLRLGLAQGLSSGGLLQPYATLGVPF